MNPIENYKRCKLCFSPFIIQTAVVKDSLVPVLVGCTVLCTNCRSEYFTTDTRGVSNLELKLHIEKEKENAK